jgi:hypothetical protein
VKNYLCFLKELMASHGDALYFLKITHGTQYAKK